MQDIESLKRQHAFVAQQFPTSEAEAAWFRERGKQVIWLTTPVPCLLVPAPTGIVYHAQVWGYSCGQQFLECFVVPLHTLEPNPEIFDPVANANRPRLYRAWHEYAEERAEIERQIRGNPENDAFTIFDFRIVDDPDNGEAWLWARGNWVSDGSEWFGVLVWQNSD